MKRLTARLLRLGRIVVAAVALVFAIVTLTPITPGITRQMAVWDAPVPATGVLIVLGAEQNADATLGIMSYWRCIYAVRAWRAGTFSKVLVSGGVAPVKPGEDPEGTAPPPLASSMAEFLAALGVPKEAIITETGSANTHENATYSARLLRSLPGPYTLITSDFHSLRAQRCFRRAGIEVNSQPAPDILKRASDWRQRWPCTFVLAEEWVKLSYYWWKGWI